VAAYYLDASSAVKGYVAERGSSRMLQILEEGVNHELYLSRIGTVEVAAALFRRTMAGGAQPEDVLSAMNRLREDIQNVYRVVELSVAMAEQAIKVAEQHRLRAYDCMQLATVLLLQEQRASFELAPLVLVSSDIELNTVAESEGLIVEDPTV
jgi:predicted nucleic acid-binding protein